MAAVTRGTPSFALPATQNTAPVHEFRCLYTHDVRKKAKKWHDGSARFHTFNKRVMVYDDTKSYIGDLHYRADEEFGEGVELQLDRGVLVEVGERIGQTHTDLTGVIHRPHTDASSPLTASATAQSRPIQRINAVTSQGRPKSLSELLGPSQGRGGRARLPLQSPFEQRHGPAQSQHDEPRSKRQKISSGKENEDPPKDYSQPVEMNNAHIQVRRATINTKVQSRRDPAGVVQSPTIMTDVGENVVDISSDEEAVIRPKKVQPLSNKRGKFDVASTNKRSISGQKSNRKAPTPISDADTRSGNKAKPVDQCCETILNAPRTSTASSPHARTPPGAPRPRVSQLRMASQKPRRKLMYRALLPSGMRKDDPVRSLNASIEEGYRARNVNVLAQSQARAPDDVATEIDQVFRLDNVTDITDMAEPSNLPAETPRRSPRKQIDPDSPLFVSQSLSQQTSPQPQRPRNDNFSILATQELFGHISKPFEDCVDNAMDVDGSDDVSDPDSPVFPQPPHRSRVTVQASPGLRAEIQHSANEAMVPEEPLPYSDHMVQPTPSPSPIEIRPTAKSLPEDNEEYGEGADGVEAFDLRPSPPQTSVNILKPPGRVQVSPPHPNFPLPASHTGKHSTTSPSIQHDELDTTAIVPHAIASPPRPPVSIEQGPWTKVEAFLLFDTWPHCKAKDKPVFERAQGSEADTGDGEEMDGVNPMPANRAFHPVIIRSARHVLRGDY